MRRVHGIGLNLIARENPCVVSPRSSSLFTEACALFRGSALPNKAFSLGPRQWNRHLSAREASRELLLTRFKLRMREWAASFHVSANITRGSALDPEKASPLRKLSRSHLAAGRIEAAIDEAWKAYDLDPDDLDSKVWIAHLVRRHPGKINADKRAALLRLINDEGVDPDHVVLAGWQLILRDPVWLEAAKKEDFETFAASLDTDELAQALLREAPVYSRAAERVLVKIRRWLLISGEWRRYRLLLDALVAQAALNGGAWPFDETEGGLLDQASELPIFTAYIPVRDFPPAPHRDISHPLMRAVAEDYERWPYPIWKRLMVQRGGTLPDVVRRLDPGGPDGIPLDAKILIAGCGTGKQAARAALDYPDAVVTAIDVSDASLRYARERCDALGIRGIRFLKLDLHRIADLHEQFDAIFCTGVLHHLPDPERGWEALVSALRPGGIMEIMVYSRISRTAIEAEREVIRGILTPGPIDDDTLRQVRHVLRDQPNSTIARYVDFSTLGGTYDIIFHRQADSFDVPRISRALDRLGLRLISFVLPTPEADRRYNAMFPHDLLHRDVEGWTKFEESEPDAFRLMYHFWCRSITSASS
jgi:SAM-dependent methyltransferase